MTNLQGSNSRHGSFHYIKISKISSFFGWGLFLLNDSINKQNSRIWADSQPEEGIEKQIHDEKVLVCCEFSSTKIYRLYFFSKSVFLRFKRLLNIKNTFSSRMEPHRIPHTIDELRTNVGRDCNKFTSEVLKPVYFLIKKPCELILSTHGGHIETN